MKNSAEPAPASTRIPHKDLRFRLELVVLVSLKITLLLIIKWLWFSEPIAPHMRASEEQINRQFFSNNTHPNTQATGVKNDRPR